MFLSICGLMSTGSRTVLVSRWRTGGETSYDLVRQFIQELPYSSAADAWQRSVQMLIQSPLDLNREPHVKRSPGGESVTGAESIFLGRLLVGRHRLVATEGRTASRADRIAAGCQRAATAPASPPIQNQPNPRKL